MHGAGLDGAGGTVEELILEEAATFGAARDVDRRRVTD
jgi:hypothetical protein